VPPLGKVLELNIIEAEKLSEDDLLELKRLADRSPEVKPRSGRSGS
jgi:hypothetical protein